MDRSTKTLASVAVALFALTAAACSSSTPTDASASGGGGAGGDTVAPAKLFGDDFKGVCQGATVSRATPYDQAKPQHKVLYFSPYKDDLVESGATELPADWQVLFDPNSDAYAKVDLVACATRTADQYVKDCTDYEDKGQPTQDVAKLHTATYAVTVHEATTGKTLATTSVVATDDSCPTLVTFDSDTETLDYYQPPPTDQVIAAVKPFAQPA